MDQQQYTFVRDNGRMYHADKETIDLLRAAQRYDQGERRLTEWGQRSVAELVFERGMATGRIGEGSALALEQGTAQGQVLDSVSVETAGEPARTAYVAAPRAQQGQGIE